MGLFSPSGGSPQDPVRRPKYWAGGLYDTLRVMQISWLKAMARCGQCDGKYPRDGHFITTYFVAVFLESLLEELST